MERSLTNKPAAVDRSEGGKRSTQFDPDTYVPHFRSLITPGLMSVPPMPAWLRRLFRHTDTPATH
jgi:hypothetical protein